jgi:hypothetical protein
MAYEASQGVFESFAAESFTLVQDRLARKLDSHETSSCAAMFRRGSL